MSEKLQLTDMGPGSLAPIIEFPSGESSVAESARTHESNEDAVSEENYVEDEFDESEDEEEKPMDITVAVSKRKEKRLRIEKGKRSVDMTPPDQLLKLAGKKARRFAEKKKFNAALRELVKCATLTKIIYGGGHWKLAEAYTSLAEGYLELKSYAPQAQFHCESAREVMNSVQTSTNSTDRASILTVSLRLYYILGKALTVLKKFSEAEVSLLQAERFCKELSKLHSVPSDEIDDWKIKVSKALAKLCGKQQKFAMATNYYEKALDYLVKKYGEDSMELIPVYQGLGAVEQSKGKLAEHETAIHYFLQAHSIAMANFNGTSLQTAETAHALATAYSNTGLIDGETSAEKYLNECLVTYQAIHGPHHEKTLGIHDELARLMVRTDRQEEALRELQQTIEPKQEVFGDYSENIAETYKLIGSIHLSKGNGDKAVRAFKKCITIESLLYGNNHKKTKDTQRTIDILLANPSVASKQPKTISEGLKDRPRFNSIVNRTTPVGGATI